MRKPAAAWLATAALLAAGCGDDKGAPPPPVKTAVVEDVAGGFRIAVPEGWEREVLPVTDPQRRWFAGRWKPANVALPVEALLVHLLAPGCPAAEIGTKFANSPIASEPEPKDYVVLSSGAGAIRGHAAFRIEVKYKSGRFGELFEASVYVETGDQTGLLVTSRGPGKSDALVRARLEAALVGLEPVARVVREGKSRPHAGGIAIGFPEGFDEYFGPSAFGTAAYAVGSSDIQGRQETVALLIGPPIPIGEQFVTSLLGEATARMKAGEARKMTIAGQEIEVHPFTPGESTPRYEVVAATFKLGEQPAALLVHAAMIPPGRAMTVFEKTAATIGLAAEGLPELRTCLFGETGSRITLAPEGWTTSVESPELMTYLEETVPSPEGGEPKKRQAAVIWATLEDDFRKDGSPMGAAKEQAAALNSKKLRCLVPDEVVLPDGRKAARVVAVTPISYETFFYARATAGSLAQVHSSSLPGLAAVTQQAALRMLEATRFATVAEMRTPAADVLERSRKEIPAIVERARKRPEGDSWFIEEVAGAPVGGQHIRVLAGGKWSDSERRPAKDTTIGSEMEGAPDVLVEHVNLNTTSKGADGKPAGFESVTESRIDGTDPKWISLSRHTEGEGLRKGRLERPDGWIPPDLSASDGLVIGLAGSGEGAYAFLVAHERFLALAWREYRVKGEEDVEVPAGKFRARRVEAGTKSVYWVAEGRVVKAEIGDFARKLTTREAAEKFLAK